MDLRLLRFFVVLAEELHFGRAAERLHMTQPPLSQSLQGMERELGVLLFSRTKRKVELTPASAAWLPYVRRVLDEAAALPKIVESLAQGELGSLTLAFVSIADYSVLPALVSRFRQAHPAVEVSLREATSDLQIEALLRREIDAGLIIPPPSGGLHAALEYLPLQRERLLLAAPTRWVHSGRLATRASSVRLAQVLHEPLILFPRRSAPAFHDLVTGYYASQGAEPRVQQEAIQMQTIISLVSAGLGLALVPASLRKLQRTGVTYLGLGHGAPSLETGLAWRKEPPAPVVKRLVEVARALRPRSPDAA